jgi:hypothetical protein
MNRLHRNIRSDAIWSSRFGIDAGIPVCLPLSLGYLIYRVAQGITKSLTELRTATIV